MGTIVVDPDIKVWELAEYLGHIAPALRAAERWHAAAHEVADTGRLEAVDKFHAESRELLTALDLIFSPVEEDPVTNPNSSITVVEPEQEIAVVQATYVVQRWEESEAGWGVRPDGWSLHCSDGDAQDFITAYWAAMPSSAPSEYERPSGPTYLVDADKLTWDEISAVSKSTNGVRFYERNYPDAR